MKVKTSQNQFYNQIRHSLMDNTCHDDNTKERRSGKRVLLSLEDLERGFFSVPCRSTGRIRIQGRGIASLISGQQCYDFFVNETWQSGLIWSRLWSKSASQIKTSNTLLVIQTEPSIPQPWILILSVVRYFHLYTLIGHLEKSSDCRLKLDFTEQEIR